MATPLLLTFYDVQAIQTSRSPRSRTFFSFFLHKRVFLRVLEVQLNPSLRQNVKVFSINFHQTGTITLNHTNRSVHSHLSRGAFQYKKLINRIGLILNSQTNSSHACPVLILLCKRNSLLHGPILLPIRFLVQKSCDVNLNKSFFKWSNNGLLLLLMDWLESGSH